MEEPIIIDNNNIESLSQQQHSTVTNIDSNAGNVLYIDKDMWWKLLYTMFITTGIGYLMAKRNSTSKFRIIKPIPVVILGYIVLLWCSIHHKSGTQQMFNLIIPNNPTTYAMYISVGLFLSAVGDFFLLYKRFFIHGVFFFLVAHISFIFAFTSSEQFFTPTVTALLVGIVCLFVYMYLAKVFPLFSKMGISKSLAIALLFYTSVIVTMCFTASVKSFLKLITIINNNHDIFSNIFSSFSFYASIGAIGAVLFFISDLMILVREINQLANGQVSTIRKLLGHGDLGMIVYWLGQFCIALSVTEF
ncbi:transmembrane protein [Dictyostelium discoideum AX4]|uniref:Lysoplasmalogenase homolog n=1 Tax=Dictyostelium discoideum TaxID=44689 RepID=TMM86_DICDI|nr:transmembrane protein [Dictyostelium discoideum AX4]Q86H31.1 RecName: Full=Lysoplasmalogenase homolog; AltName: Full=Transmembrane protein 86 homolog [Dictyostelium discoideum]EAL69583.1 transmembrane protein [Dictyostelium discoideum AX4]|eukprot:XP_643513.1 transmembrane protein [Dictyostelium discoideum AX4]